MKLLNKIYKPNDLKNLTSDELIELSSEIRNFLIENISKTGGHLSSNLGVVELTIALLYCLNQPKDKIVWDVGHQSYVHKILTNRMNNFSTLRNFNGLCGFPKPNESEYDAFTVGHSSTSISVGLGLAIASKLSNTKEKVISVIGDGALTGGMAYEALNHAGRLNSDLIVILNDNQMSIGENTGALSKNLNNVRVTDSYLSAKRDINNVLKKVPVVGNKTKMVIDSTKDKLKTLLLEEGNFFQELGFKYYGKIDGHNISELIKYIRVAMTVGGPVILHVSTVKGKGYTLAEKNPTSFHGVDKFNIKTGVSLVKKEKSYTDIFSDTIVKLGESNSKVVTITASMPDGTGLKVFRNKFEDRYFDVGIAEEHAVTLAGGLSKNGMIPFVAIYSTFLQRAYDQIIHDIAIQNLHVVFCIDRAGIVGKDGETHQGVFDIAFLNHIPNIAILAPANGDELVKIMNFAINYKAPIAIRYPRSTEVNTLIDNNIEICTSKSNTIFLGEEIALVSVGSMLTICYEAYKKLKSENINITLINLIFIKPIDLDMIKSLANYKSVIVVEDSINFGGVSNIILKYFNDFNINVKVHSFAYEDKFIQHGDIKELQENENISTVDIYNKVKQLKYKEI